MISTGVYHIFVAEVYMSMNIVKRHCKLFASPIEIKCKNEIAQPLLFKDIHTLHVILGLLHVSYVYHACVMVKLCYLV